jgi:hypothetical protein
MKDLFETLAKAEHLMDWAICGDTLKEDKLSELWDLWENYFNRHYG